MADINVQGYLDSFMISEFDQEKLKVSDTFFEDVWKVVYLHDMEDAALTNGKINKIGHFFWKEFESNKESCRSIDSIISILSQGLEDDNNSFMFKVTFFDTLSSSEMTKYYQVNDARMREHGIYYFYEEKAIIVNIHDQPLVVPFGSGLKLVKKIELVVNNSTLLNLGPIHTNLSKLLLGSLAKHKSNQLKGRLIFGDDEREITIREKMFGLDHIDLITTLTSRDQYLLAAQKSSFEKYIYQTFVKIINESNKELAYNFDRLGTLENVLLDVIEKFYSKCFVDEGMSNKAELTKYVKDAFKLENHNERAYRILKVNQLFNEYLAISYDKDKTKVTSTNDKWFARDAKTKLDYLAYLNETISGDSNFKDVADKVSSPILSSTTVTPASSSLNDIQVYDEYPMVYAMPLANETPPNYYQGNGLLMGDIDTYINGTPNSNTKKLVVQSTITYYSEFTKYVEGCRKEDVTIHYAFDKFNSSIIDSNISRSNLNYHKRSVATDYHNSAPVGIKDHNQVKYFAGTHDNDGLKFPTPEATSIKKHRILQWNGSGSHYHGDMLLVDVKQAVLWDPVIFPNIIGQMMSMRYVTPEFNKKDETTLGAPTVPVNVMTHVNFLCENLLFYPLSPLFIVKTCKQWSRVSETWVGSNSYVNATFSGVKDMLSFDNSSAIMIRLLIMIKLINDNRLHEAYVMGLFTFANNVDSQNILGVLYKRMNKSLFDMMFREETHHN